MQKRIFTFKVPTVFGHDFDGDVWSQVEVDRDGNVRVTTSLLDEEHGRRDRFDHPAGTIQPWPTLRGTPRYQYRYPTGHTYPGYHRTVREAAQEAAPWATGTFIKSLTEAK